MKARLPIIQGGMAVRVSTARLAAAVASEGGLGVIAGTGLSVQALQEEIRKARRLTAGHIGVNILFAASQFAQLVKAAMKEKVDFIVSGAGFSRDIFAWSREMKVPVLSMASSARVAQLAEKLGAAAVIVEGKEAGGHLGTQRSLLSILQEVVAAVKIPVIAAGGIMNGRQLARALDAGAQGVQMATRFVLSEECEAHPNFKQLVLDSKPEDSVIIDSPVGMPGRALRNRLTEKLAAGETIPVPKCNHCLKNCTHSFCILDALQKAVDGDIENGLVFSGEHFYQAKKIQPVRKILTELNREYEEATAAKT
ncbi:MAG: nitronate monooxygenase [Firmicutes bacterium]|jgi:NAD(P)H-dependent flavin oxidoreductase YrpB (nitropropane dioxygenase family)|nr:nitronate monooxygenase [Bacillota bacterium]